MWASITWPMRWEDSSALFYPVGYTKTTALFPVFGCPLVFLPLPALSRSGYLKTATRSIDSNSSTPSRVFTLNLLGVPPKASHLVRVYGFNMKRTNFCFRHFNPSSRFNCLVADQRPSHSRIMMSR